MPSIDLIERLVPSPSTTIVVETSDALMLVDTARRARDGDLVLTPDDSIKPYRTPEKALGVAYCSIRFLA